MSRLPALLLAASLLPACRLEAGEPCEVTGDGFTRYDPCEETCVTWTVSCDDGSTTTPNVCSAGACRTDRDCPSDFTCRSVGFDSECLPADTCPD